MRGAALLCCLIALFSNPIDGMQLALNDRAYLAIEGFDVFRALVSKSEGAFLVKNVLV